MTSNYNKQSILVKNTTKNIVILLFFAPFIPCIFYIANQILAIIISMVNKNYHLNFAQAIFNASFTDKINKMNFIPSSVSDHNFTDQSHFSYLICIISYFLITYILFIICAKTIMLSIELL